MPDFSSRASGETLAVAFFASALLLAFAVAAGAQEPVTTTTTLPGECGNAVVEAFEDCDVGDTTPPAGQACAADCRAGRCGKPGGGGGSGPLASDALYALRTSVGLVVCAPCVCDVDDNGIVAASDALTILRRSVGQAVTLACAACADLRRQGRFLVQEAFPIPVEAREGILEEKAHIEASGVTVADDGSVVTWPERGAGGWWVRFGEAFALTEVDGTFRIRIPEGSPTTGTIAHPQQSDTALFAIALPDLVPLDSNPVPFTFQREFYGPCGMNEEEEFPDPSVCSEIVPPVSALVGPGKDHPMHPEEDRAADLHAHHDAHAVEAEAQGGSTRGQFSNVEPPFTTAVRGTYPAGDQNCCKDYDGGNYDGGTLSGTILNYYGSTCQKYVSSGCCGGELGSLKNSALSSLGLLSPVSCQKNHDGRYCQELKEGDVSVDFNGFVALAFNSIASPSINQGESVSFVLHNNGCFGETAVERFETEIFGVLTGAGYDGSKVDHAAGATYAPDRAMTFSTNRCVGSTVLYAHDRYRFSTDGKWTEVWFTMSPQGLYRFLPNGPVFSALASNRYAFNIANVDQCDGLHVHGQNPCTGAPEPPGAGPCGHGKVEVYNPPFRS